PGGPARCHLGRRSRGGDTRGETTAREGETSDKAAPATQPLAARPNLVTPLMVAMRPRRSYRQNEREKLSRSSVASDRHRPCGLERLESRSEATVWANLFPPRRRQRRTDERPKPQSTECCTMPYAPT